MATNLPAEHGHAIADFCKNRGVSRRYLDISADAKETAAMHPTTNGDI
jgi:hypothetical protein